MTDAGPGPEADDNTPTHPAATGKDHIETARDYIANHYRQWIDLPLPVLAGKTPATGCEEPQTAPETRRHGPGKPDPTDLSESHIQINAPREMTLRELGLD